MSRYIVLDTNVLVSAQLSMAGSPYIIWEKIIDGEFTLVCSVDILSEYREVLSRDKFASVISKENKDSMLDFIEASCKRISPNKSAIDMPDEGDRVFYDAANESGTVLVAGNSKHYPNEPWILSPTEFVNS